MGDEAESVDDEKNDAEDDKATRPKTSTTRRTMRAIGPKMQLPKTMTSRSPSHPNSGGHPEAGSRLGVQTSSRGLRSISSARHHYEECQTLAAGQNLS